MARKGLSLWGKKEEQVDKLDVVRIAVEDLILIRDSCFEGCSECFNEHCDRCKLKGALDRAKDILEANDRQRKDKRWKRVYFK